MSMAETSTIMPDEAVTFWENVGKNSRMGQYITNIEKEVILDAHRELQMPELALEVGCDGGRWSQLLAGLGWQMICDDINPVSLAVCKKRIPNSECILVDPAQPTLPCDDATLKLLLCVEVPPVVESNWFPSEAARVLKKKGILVGNYWNSNSFRGQFCRLKGRVTSCAADKGFYHGRPYAEFKNEMMREGFRFTFEKGLCWLPFSRTSNSSLIPFCAKMEEITQLGKCIRFSPWIIYHAVRE